MRDGDDTYLVVAADKGTATFSDTANRVSQEYGFWLDDAFASGGSAGYDHKALGITAQAARGSRSSATSRELGRRHAGRRVHRRRHRRHVRRRVRQRDAAVASTIRLVAAYDHRHVFIDPAPGRRRRGFAERKRLFELAGSSWDDYDRELISEGGGVCPRTREVDPALAAGARGAGHRATSALPPTEVIRAILRAPVDLLWNGGIGTRRQGLDGDRRRRARPLLATRSASTRDELRARVVGEGGNLGFTRRARVEYSRRRRAHQRRLHRQLGRRRLLRPRGQPEDPARPGRARAAS